ncbi:SRPBCC family protein [Flavisolibacter nicotianae]|uniref:hypothetical protein n=1 Tax=Flavisolibacter nicotianae TaxID=2364882 RepID=UPI000EB2E4E7|nr:hypothetical protein [Flavisolibacter nicotianae]
MRIIKLGILSFVFLFVLMTLISLLIPSQIRLSKATNLPNNRQRIWAIVKTDTSWHPAYRDTATVKAFSVLQKTVVAQTDSTYVVQLLQPGRTPVTSGFQLYGKPESDSLTLQWYMDFRLGWYPWQKFSSLFYERTYGSMMEKGLANIKEQLVY